MYRGSAAGVLVEQGVFSNPPQKPQKDDYVDLVNVIQAALHVKGCPLRMGLQNSFGRSSAQNSGLGG